MAFIQFQFRRGSEAEWASANSVLANGEIGVALDTRNFKIGNGVDAWTNLSYGGLQGPNGSTGVGITSALVNANGHLMVTFSNSVVANAGYVVGAAGPTGNTGANGAAGATGATGANGVGITSATIDGSGYLIITYSNSATANAGYVVGPAGANGANGTNGTNGTNGVNGVDGSNGISITSSVVNSNGYLIITYSNSATSNAGYVVGNFDANTAGSLNVNSALTSNNSSYLGGNSAADLRTYADNKAGNAYSNAVAYTDATFQTMTGLSANVAILSANAATYLNGKTESNLNVNNSLTSNNASYLGGNTASDLRTYTDNKSGNAYTNATTFASNATNISSGTLGEARLPYRMDQNVRTTDTVSFGNMTITGNLTVTGNVAVIGANNLTLIDNMIYLNSNNNVTNPDLGFAGNYNDGSYHHAGFFRDATDGFWKVFDNYAPEPDASPYIDTANATFHIADFHANTHRVGNTSVYATINSTAFSGSANNASYLGGTAAAGYQTTAGLSANVATLTANAAGYLNGKTESNLNVNSALVSNLATYIVANTGLVSNASGVFVNASYVATQNANNATYAFGKSEGNLNVNNALTANSASYLGSSNNTGNTTGIYTTGVVTANGTITGLDLVSTAASGDEGGEIRLAKAPNGTTNGVITIDVYQNKIRIFESGGNNRGAYIDISAAANGVGTNLLTGGGGGTGTVTSVGSGNGLTGGPITGSGTLSILANTGIVANATGLFVNSAYIGTITSNNATYAFGKTEGNLNVNNSLTSNNASYLNDTAAANYVQNTDSRTLSGNLNFTGANTTISGNLTITSTGELIITSGAGIYANGGLGSSGQVLTSNGSSVYWSTPSSGGGSSNVTTGKAIAMAIVFGG